jgi:hypothetical protein
MPFEYKPCSIIENTNIQEGRSNWCRLRLDRVVWKPTTVRFPAKGNWPVQDVLDDTHILVLDKCRMFIWDDGRRAFHLSRLHLSDGVEPVLLHHWITRSRFVGA